MADDDDFATTLKEQEAQLKSNTLVQRFAESRKALASDSYRPAYHFVSPESSLDDPNGHGGDANVKSLDAWQIKLIWPMVAAGK